MTNDEAIKWLKLDIEMMKFDSTTGDETYLDDDAINVIIAKEMAIEALRSQALPSSDIDDIDDELVSRGDVISAINRSFARYKIVEESHGEKHVKWTEEFIKFSDVLNTVKNIPSKQMQEEKPFEDCISRQEAINKIIAIFSKRSGTVGILLWTNAEIKEMVTEALKNLPSKQPKQKCGRWLISSDGYYPYCSECKTEPKNGIMTKFCPSCGIKMDWKDYE